MSEKELRNINRKLIDVLSEDKGFFGRIDTWGQRLTKYEFIGYKFDTDFLTTLNKMSPGQRKNLVKIIIYLLLILNLVAQESASSWEGIKLVSHSP